MINILITQIVYISPVVIKQTTQMLEKLSPEQEKLMYEHRDGYIDYVVNNYKYRTPTKDGPKPLLQLEDIKDDIEWIYKKAGLEKPKFIFIADSYLQEKLMINYIINGGLEECLKGIQKNFKNEEKKTKKPD